jgi:2,3-dihydroxybenzoate decarboxylase
MPIRELPTIGLPTNPLGPPRKIALEEHFMSPALTHPYYGDSFGGEFSQNGRTGFVPEYDEAVTARMDDLRESRIDEMDAAGIEVSILSQTIGGVEGMTDAALAVETARKTNDWLAGEVAASDGRFAGFACLALQDVGASVDELHRAVNELGLCAVMVNGYSNLGDERLYLDAERFEPLWTALEDLRVPLYLHPRLPSTAVQDAVYHGHPELVGATWGFGPETATHTLRMVYSGVFDRHPGVNLVLGHLGEMLPFFAWRIQRGFELNPYTWRTQKRLQDYLSDNIWVTTSGNFSDQALITALLQIGADHIMFASDYPYDMATEAARWIERAPISERDRRKICCDNAAGLFRLPEASTRRLTRGAEATIGASGQ